LTVFLLRLGVHCDVKISLCAESTPVCPSVRPSGACRFSVCRIFVAFDMFRYASSMPKMTSWHWRRGPIRYAETWDCGFESRLGYGCLSWVLFVEVEVAMAGWSLVQRSPNVCGVSECDHKAYPILRSPWPNRGCCAMGWGMGGVICPICNLRCGNCVMWKEMSPVLCWLNFSISCS